MTHFKYSMEFLTRIRSRSTAKNFPSAILRLVVMETTIFLCLFLSLPTRSAAGENVHCPMCCERKLRSDNSNWRRPVETSISRIFRTIARVLIHASHWRERILHGIRNVGKIICCSFTLSTCWRKKSDSGRFSIRWEKSSCHYINSFHILGDHYT